MPPHRVQCPSPYDVKHLDPIGARRDKYLISITKRYITDLATGTRIVLQKLCRPDVPYLDILEPTNGQKRAILTELHLL